MRLLAAMLLLAGCLAGETANKPAGNPAAKPNCSRHRAGSLWPEEANTDPALARRLAREGNLEICTRTAWSYRWISPTVDVRQLRKARGGE